MPRAEDTQASNSSADRDRVEILAEEFLARLRCGAQPSVSEYAANHPELAEEIRDVFSALMMMEDIRPGVASADGLGPIATGERLAFKTLGDFRILREAGRGGMGIVYEAEQVSLGRRVALKVLPKSLLTCAQFKERFQREARAAAKLHHTNIIPVFGVGEQDGLHYYVMQFIPGRGLDEVLVELRRMWRAGEPIDSEPPRSESVAAGRAAAAAVKSQTARSVAESLVSEFRRTVLYQNSSGGDEPDSPLPDTSTEALERPASAIDDTAVDRLSDTWNQGGPFGLTGQDETTTRTHCRTVYWQSVAKLGMQVAGALQYAHDQGVIHRDIKPANLLLDTQGTAWITDFGLAKAEDQHDLTHTGNVLGTLRYMAPEQFEGAADARSDVYSLGLTLYELLALRPAFDATARQKLVVQITEGTPPRLRSLDAHIPRDLETIVHKAIERETSHRYQTAGELAADLQRFLADEPIRARRTSIAARFGRWCRRKPALASTSVAVVLLLLLVTAISTAAYRKTAAALAQARQGTSRANTQFARANREAETSKHMADALVGLFEAPAASGWLGYQLGAVKAVQNPLTAREILDRSAQKTLDELEDQPEVQVRLMDTIGHIYRSLGELNEAEPLLVKALAKRREMFGEQHQDVATSLEHMATLRYDQGSSYESARLHREALEMRRRLLGSDSLFVAESLTLLGFVETQNIRFEDAEQCFSESLKIREKLAKKGDLPSNHRSIGIAKCGLGWVKARQAASLPQKDRLLRLAHAQWLNNQAKTIAADIDGGENMGMVACGHVDAVISHLLGKHSEAEIQFQKNVALARRVLGEKHPIVALLTKELGTALQAVGKLAWAEKAFRDLLAQLRELYGDEHPLVADGMFCLATSMNRDNAGKRRLEEAEQLFLKALELQEERWKDSREDRREDQPDLRSLALIEGGFGLLLARLDRRAEAEEHLRRGAELRVLWEGSSGHRGGMVLFHKYRHLAFNRAAMGNFPGAVEAFRKADDDVDARILEKGETPPLLHWERVNKVDLCRRTRACANELLQQKQYEEAETICRDVLARAKRRAIHPSGAPLLRDEIARTYASLTQALLGKGDHAPAAEAARCIAETVPENWIDLRSAAEYLDNCAELASNDTTLSGADREAATHKYRERERDYRARAKDRVLAAIKEAVEPAQQNVLAWELCETRYGQPEYARLALPLVQRAVENGPNAAELWKTLGVAHYRAGDFDSAASALKECFNRFRMKPLNNSRKRLFSQSAFFLAMTDHRLGHADEAEKWYSMAQEWMEANGPGNEDLRRFRHEAASLLNVDDQSEGATEPAEDTELVLYTRVIELLPDAPWAYAERGRIHKKHHEFRLAESDYRNAVELFDRAYQDLGPVKMADSWVYAATLHTELAQWDNAAADFSRAAELSNNAVHWYWQALSHLGAGDESAYRDVCMWMAHQFGATDKPAEAHWFAWTCSLAPRAFDGLAPTVELAEKAAAADLAEQQDVTLGAILFRAGRFEEAVKQHTDLTSQWDAGYPKPTLTSPAYAWYFLAMAQHSCGAHDEAEATLARAIRWHEEKLRQHDAGTDVLDWNRILTLSLLRREAEETVGEHRIPISELQKH